MSEHPKSQAVADLLQGRLSFREARLVVGHLVHGCASCAEALWPPVDEDAYEPAIDAVIAKAEKRQREWTKAEEWLTRYYLQRARKPFSQYSRRKKKRLATWGLCEVLLRASHSMRRSSPQGMVHLAEIAIEVAALVPFRPFRYDQRWDLEARANGELANAYRVADDLPQAETTLHQAFGLFEKGTQDPLLLARLRDIAASLFAAQRRFENAYKALAEARALYLHEGDRHRAGRTLISAGLFAGYDGDPESAIEKLVMGLKEIDRDLDPDLTYRALHNLLLFTVEVGDYEEARVLFAMLRPLSERQASDLELVSLGGVRGTIAVGLGDLEGAEREFQETRRAFAAAGLLYHSAYTGLVLAAVWFRQGRTAEVKGIVGELVTSFRRVDVKRDALAALVLLHKAVAQDRATLELIERTRGVLGRLAEGPRRSMSSF